MQQHRGVNVCFYLTKNSPDEAEVRGRDYIYIIIQLEEKADKKIVEIRVGVSK